MVLVPSEPIIFYDIASGPPVRTYAPNPWKTRLALNFKRVDYKTSWTDLTQVASTRKALGVPPCRKFWHDGTDFYTLPVISDPSTGTLVGDSFEIAEYLDKTYPNNPTLIPPGTLSLHKALNGYVDQLFTSHVSVCVGKMPFNPETFETTKIEWCKRAGVNTWEEMLQTSEGENRKKIFASLEKALGPEPLDGLCKAFLKQDEGPFLEGSKPMYADFIIGAWLMMFMRCLPEAEWEMMRGWQGGMWGRLVDALEEYTHTDSNRDG
ncbi:hypothetical protein TWF694_002442 [Orbilia ellipsospora]|uniref:GST N-terminal domain-containing protein n=1 Tax=Orbilia ellipsospora TaxID=2528407 RepID=A0AAV9X4J3_9PEZI